VSVLQMDTDVIVLLVTNQVMNWCN